MTALSNIHVKSIDALMRPDELIAELPPSDAVVQTVLAGRNAVWDVLDRKSDRFLVVVGPCSIHDPSAALEYASKLKEAADRHKDDLAIMMRVYFEKPRTTVGWKGLINDPNLDDSFQINDGLRKARKLLLDLNGMGLPCATEFLDLITPQFISGLITWGAIGARTTESQSHRELASGLSAPIGFKNGTSGDVKIAVDAVMSSTRPHRFVGVTEEGRAAIVRTTGNRHCHVILRGGSVGPNYDAESVQAAGELLEAAECPGNVMVDCSHGNSNKDYERQPIVAEALAEQIEAGSKYLIGAMIESHLTAGNQKLEDPRDLEYGKSITDACISWEMTTPVLDRLAQAVRTRRAKS